jgi:integrase-like protein
VAGARIYPIIGALQVQDIETVHIDKILRPIWNEKTETTTRVRGRIEKRPTYSSPLHDVNSGA